MILSIVTIVRHDLPGLRATLDSAARLRSRPDVEHWVIDGSDADHNAVRDHLAAVAAQSAVKWISERDRGIYDGMNKGLERSTGDFVVFLNAGDTFSPLLDADLLFERLRSERCVLLGHTIETWQGDRWLRPGIGRERDVFAAPPHQATFYPRSFYATERYRLDRRVTADTDYTRRAMARCGAAYLPTIVSEFALGGVSSTYGKQSPVLTRIRQCGSISGKAKLLFKVVLWNLLSRRAFYRTLAAGKYTRLRDDHAPITLGGRNVQPLQPAQR
jgi:putative colanic acid biosynthesis glycosyltransferase